MGFSLHHRLFVSYVQLCREWNPDIPFPHSHIPLRPSLVPVNPSHCSTISTDPWKSHESRKIQPHSILPSTFAENCRHGDDNFLLHSLEMRHGFSYETGSPFWDIIWFKLDKEGVSFFVLLLRVHSCFVVMMGGDFSFPLLIPSILILIMNYI